MNWDQIEGNWKQFRGLVREKWGKITDDELEVLKGEKDKLVGRLQESYGFTRQEALKELDQLEADFNRNVRDRKSASGAPASLAEGRDTKSPF